MLSSWFTQHKLAMLLLRARLPYSIRHDKAICEAHDCGTCATFSRAYRSSLALQYARRFRQPFPGLRGGTGLNAAHPRLEETFTGLSTNLKRIR